MESQNTGYNPSGATSADSVVNKAALGAHSAVDKAIGVADEAARKAKPAIERVAGYAHSAVDKAAGAAAPAADWLDEHGQDLKVTQEKLVAATADYMRAHPWKSLGVAVVAGVLIGRIIL
jgi:ElaB/YqjD/DUF883 family membrane-anchored ribosome-binding protein